MLLAISQVCYGQTVFRSVEDIWKYADAHNINIITAKYEAQKALYAQRQSYAALLPQVNATGSYTDNLALQTTLIPAFIFGGPPGAYKSLQFGQQFVYAGGITAQMPVLNLQNWYNTAIAKQNEEMNRDSIASTRKAVYQQIATQYYGYLLMQEAARLAAQSASVADSVFQSISNKFSTGTANQANVDVARLNFERAQQNMITARYQVRIAQNNIKALLGLSLKDSIRIDATLKDDLKLDVSNTFQEDPSLRIAWWKTKLNFSQYRQANAAFAPTINVLYNYTTQRFDNKFEPFADASGTAAWFPAQYWSIQASWQLITIGNRLYQSKRLKLAYRESVDQYENAKNQSAINDENIRLNYETAVAVLSKAESVMNLSFDNYQHVTYRYETGIESIETRLNAFRDYIDYQNQYLNSLSDMLVQLYQVKIRQQSF